mmetsp:Transcript_19552/g.52716  ORF Transcript_19552/g.52716 Transcript_19552/m.52716 type:complete len:214 (+) Transcript_19552:736-1377(+)
MLCLLKQCRGRAHCNRAHAIEGAGEGAHHVAEGLGRGVGVGDGLGALRLQLAEGLAHLGHAEGGGHSLKSGNARSGARRLHSRITSDGRLVGVGVVQVNNGLAHGIQTWVAQEVGGDAREFEVLGHLRVARVRHLQDVDEWGDVLAVDARAVTAALAFAHILEEHTQGPIGFQLRDGRAVVARRRSPCCGGQSREGESQVHRAERVRCPSDLA